MHRLGKSGNASSLSIALSDAGKVSATTIVVNCDNTGGKNNSSATLSVNGTTAQTTTTTAADYTFTINADIESITLAGSASVRVYSITVNYGGGCTGTKLGTPVVTASASDRQVVLTWPNVANASGYQLKWNGGEWASATSPVTQTSLTNGTTYTYQVKAIGNGSTYCDGDASDEASATPNVYYTVTWMNNGSEYTTTSVVSGQRPTFPDAPTSCDAGDGASTTFYGWSTSTWSGKIDDISAKTIYTKASDMPTVTGNGVVYHAVFCKGGGGSVEVNTTNSSVTGSYADLDFDVDGIKFNTTQWIKNTNIQAKKNTIYSLYNTNAFLSDISSIQVIQTGTARAITIHGRNYYNEDEAKKAGETFVEEQITSPSTSLDMTFNFTGKSFKYFYLSTPSNAVYMDKIIINYGSAASKYITSCCQPLGEINGSVNMSQNSASLSWSLQNAQNGGLEHITSWKVEYIKDGDADWTVAESTLAKATLTKTISNLDCNSDYSFRVSANVEDGYCADAYEVTDKKTSQYTITLTGSGTVTGGTFTVKGQSAASVSACDGDNIAIVATRSTGYNFSGWTIAKTEGTVSPAAATASTSFTMPAENVTVTAAFAAQHHNVVFHKNDGGEDETDTQDFTYGVAQKLKAIETIGWTRTNYVFGGWMTASNGSSADYDDEYSYTLNTEDNVNLYALWVANNTRTISYSGDTYITSYSSKPTTVDIENDDEFSVSFTLNSHYKLTGVSVSMGGEALAANLISFDQSSLTVTAPDGGFTDNLSVTFTTAEIKHTVTFHAGTGSCATESLTQASYGAAIALPSATIGAQGWSFVGWAEASVASATSVAPTLHTESFTPKADDDLYAVYRKTITEGGTNQVQFTYDSHEGWDGTAAGVSGNNPYFLLEGSEYMESSEIADMSKISSIEVSVGKYNNKGAYSITGGGTGIATGGIPSTTGANDRTILKANFSNTLSGAGKIRITNTDGTSGSGTRLYAMTINIDVPAVYSYHSTPASATGLAVQVAPTKTVYKVGDTFDPAGTTLRVTYSNSTTEDITSGFTYSPTTALTKENTSVTFSYLGLNCNQAISVLDPVATPTFSPASGSEVSVSETITISCETASATIYYTTDGSDPTNTSAVYSTPIAPYSTIKAIAMKAGMAPSEIATATYTVVKNSQTLTFTQPSYSFRLNSDEYNAFEHQAVSGAVTTVTYSSSNTAVADIEGGVVVLKGGKGTATITATAAETATYSSASATYTITVLREGATRTGDFVLVTDVNDLAEGDYVILTEEDDDNPYVFSGISTSNAGTVQVKNAANDVITYSQFTAEGNEAKIIYLEKVGDYWAFNYGTESDVYIAAGTSTGSGAAALRGLEEIDDYCKWDISFDGKNAIAENQGNSTYPRLSFNSSAVKSYKTKQSGGLRIYKQQDRNLTPQTLSFETASYEFPLNESGYTSFTHQAVSGAQTAVTYTSGNTDVAAIVNNEVVLQGKVGTATITATAEADETYQTASATYTITVTAALRTVTFHYYKPADATADQTALKEESSGAGITVPANPANVGEYTFLGWAPATLVETQTAPNNLVAALQAGATYHPTTDENYYAIYRRLENSDGRFYLMHDNNYAKAPVGTDTKSFGNTTNIEEAAVFVQTGDNKLYYDNNGTPRYLSSTNTSARDLDFTTNAAEAQVWTITESGLTTTFYSSISEKYLAHNGNMWAAYSTGSINAANQSKDLTTVYLADVYYSSTPNLMVSPVLTWAQGNATHVMEIEATYDNAATATVNDVPVSVTYSSSDETKATVNNAGVVTAHLGGLVTITATVAENPGVSRALVETYQVSITKKVPQITFDNEANWKVYVGEAYKRVLAGQVTITTDGAVTYTLSNNATSSDWASINSETGEVTGLSTGNQSSKLQYLYVHTAETDMYQAGEANKQFQVLALKNQALAFAQDAYVYEMNESIDPFVNTLSGNQTAVAYGSDNTDVAEVDEASGEVTVHTNVCGTATITATAAEGYSGTDVYNQATQSYTITVNYPMPTFSMESSNIKAPVSLAISGYDENTKLYYTDGEGDPATLYSEPLAISATKTIRAKATNADGSLVSPIASVTLTKVTPTVTGTQNGGTITLSSDENSLITYIILNQNAVTVAEGTDVASPVVFNTELSGTYTVSASAKWDVENGFTGEDYDHDFTVKGKGHLPISYTGDGTNGIANEPWATRIGNVSNYNGGDVKFDGSGLALIAAFVEKPIQLSYSIKHNPSESKAWTATENVYKVQWSADGETYTDIKVYDSSTPITTAVINETFNLDASARYIKWIYVTKDSDKGGNVALNNIRITCEAVIIDGISVLDIPDGYEGDVIVEDGGTLTIDEETNLINLTVEAGGVVSGSSELTVVNNLTIESSLSGSTSGQVKGNIDVHGDAFFDLTFAESEVTYGWYTFTVPFLVDGSKGVYNAKTGAKLTYNSDYSLMTYDGARRARGQYGWVRHSGMLRPGVLYIISLADAEYNKIRFKKASGSVVASEEIALSAYAVSGSGANGTDNGWNGVGNSNLYYSEASADDIDKISVYDHANDKFDVENMSEYEAYVVGSAFFVQSPADENLTLAAVETPSSLRAPRRVAEATDEFKVRLGRDLSSYDDQLFVSASTDAVMEYVTGRDLVKFGSFGTPKVAQMAVEGYGMRLADAEFPLVNSTAEFPLELTAPAAGTWQLYVADGPTDAELWLMRDGVAIWNLSMSEYVLALPKGSTTGYSLRLIANPSGVTTGMEGVQSDNVQCTKAVIDGVLYILRGGQMYDATGKAVR